MSVEFGAFLRDLRLRRGLSREKLAQVGGLATRTISYWESGRHSPGKAEWAHLMQALDASADERIQAASLLTTRRGLHIADQEMQERDTEAIRPGPPPDLGDLVRALRMRQGFTQAQVAARLGVSADTVNRWERTRNLPGKENLDRLCNLLNAFPDERQALQRRRLAPLHWEAELSWEDCLHQIEIIAPIFWEDPLAELTFLALKRQVYSYFGRIPEARLRFAILDAHHASLLYQQTRNAESQALAYRSLTLLPYAFPGDPLRFGVLNLAAVHANSNRGVFEYEAGLALYKCWLPRLWGVQRIIPFCDMALFTAFQKRFDETEILLRKARDILESQGDSVVEHWGYFNTTSAQILRISGKPVEALFLLPPIEDEATAPRSTLMTWAATLIEAGETAMATRYVNRVADHIAAFPSRHDLRQWDKLRRRL